MRRKIVSAAPKSIERSGLKCWPCTRFECVTEDNDPVKRGRIKAENMRRIIKAWGECGKIVYVGNEALAYAQYGPAEFWKGVDRFLPVKISKDAIFLTCLYVVPHARGKGLGRVLLQSIEAGLVKRKVRAIETFAIRSEDHPPGSVEFFLQNGFYILRDHPEHPLLRLDLKVLVGWQINIQFALDRLKIPARRPASAPISPSSCFLKNSEARIQNPEGKWV